MTRGASMRSSCMRLGAGWFCLQHMQLCHVRVGAKAGCETDIQALLLHAPWGRLALPAAPQLVSGFRVQPKASCMRSMVLPACQEGGWPQVETRGHLGEYE